MASDQVRVLPRAATAVAGFIGAEVWPMRHMFGRMNEKDEGRKASRIGVERIFHHRQFCEGGSADTSVTGPRQRDACELFRLLRIPYFRLSCST